MVAVSWELRLEPSKGFFNQISVIGLVRNLSVQVGVLRACW